MGTSRKSDGSNRRQETRYRGDCRKVVWRPVIGDEPAPGALFDISASGVSFLVPDQHLVPHIGEEIAVRQQKSTSEPLVYRVLRIEPLKAGTILLGCCRAIEVEVQTHRICLPHLSTSAKMPAIRAARSPRRVVVTHMVGYEPRAAKEYRSGKPTPRSRVLRIPVTGQEQVLSVAGA
jgi:hypothetical protein